MSPMKSRGPVISVLINNYNNGRWLRACVDSVLAQTRPADEVIVYDDGSTDDSIAILRGYGERITLIEGVHDFGSNGRENQARAVERLVAASRGDHVYMLDGDDVFMPGKIAAYEARWAQRPEAVLMQAPMQLVDSEENFLRSNFEAKRHPDDYLEATYRADDSDLYYTTSALAFRGDYLRRVLPMKFCRRLNLAVDSLLSRVAPFYGPVASLKEPQTCWRQHPRSMGHLYGVSYAWDIYTNCVYFNREARRLGRPGIRLWKCRSFYVVVFNGWGSRWLVNAVHSLKRGLRGSRGGREVSP